MNERIKELAEQAGITERWNGWNSVIPVNGDGVQSEDLERFAKLIRTDEREACAKLCEEMAVTLRCEELTPFDVADKCAKAIRQQGEK